MSPVVKVMPCSTSGNQRWRGASPTFSAKAVMAMEEVRGWDIWLISHWPRIQALVDAANKIMAAAVAWMRKYLVVASTARGWCFWAMRGMMASVLISNPIQARSQCELIKVRVVPSPRLISNMANT